MALSFCACGKDNSQTPTTPAATPTPEAANTPAPQESEAPADEPEATPNTTPEAAPEATPAPSGNIREESTTGSGTPIVLEYDSVTGELVKTEFYSDDGALESAQFFENEQTVMQIDYRPDGQIDCEYYFENDEVVYIVFYNYDSNGNLIDTTTEDMSWQGGGEDPGYNDVQLEENGDGSYTVTEYDSYGMPVYASYYDANDVLISETIFDNGMAVLVNYYENYELVSYEEYLYNGYELTWSGSYSRTAGGDFVLESEQYYSNGQPVVNDQPSGNDQPSVPQSGSLPTLSEYDYIGMSASEVESALAANGFTVSKEIIEYDFADYTSTQVYGDGPAYRRATVSMDTAGETLPWILFTHNADDSSAPMDIGLRGIKTHDSLLTVMKKLGIRNADAVAEKLNYVYNADDYSAWDDSVLSEYTEGNNYVYFGTADTGKDGKNIDQISINIGYDAEYFTTCFYFEDGILVSFETM